MSKDKVYSFTASKLGRLISGGSPGLQKAQLAELRRGAGKDPGDLPDLWGAILEDMPEELMGKAAEPSYAEWAIYTALTLYAVHQQGSDPSVKPMHVKGRSFGSAVAELAKDEGDKERIIRRFNAAATASEPAEIAHHLRSLVQLLRDEGIPLDYAGLAADLYSYRFEQSRANIRLSWGRDFYKVINSRKDKENEE